jgi:hypothetical protein
MVRTAPYTTHCMAFSPYWTFAGPLADTKLFRNRPQSGGYLFSFALRIPLNDLMLHSLFEEISCDYRAGFAASVIRHRVMQAMGDSPTVRLKVCAYSLVMSSLETAMNSSIRNPQMNKLDEGY